MIPKFIHYCWFGRNPLPESAKKCIDSWRKFLPDYEIKEWNETNFDVNIIPYTTQAYKTYMGQISSGDEIACIKGMKNKKLITEEKAESLVESYMLGYTE